VYVSPFSNAVWLGLRQSFFDRGDDGGKYFLFLCAVCDFRPLEHHWATSGGTPMRDLGMIASLLLTPDS
jgi:hypothetical protein